MKILLILALSVPAFANWPNGYTYKRSITIDHTKVQSADQTDFPVLVCFNSSTGSVCDGANSNTALAGLKTVANSGKVVNTVSATVPYTHTVCADCIITDTDGTTVLKFEIEKYVASTGEFIAWVKIPTLTTASDYVIYIYYGNSSVTTDQEDVHNTWNSGYKYVGHFQDGSSLQLVDSTSNAASGTNNSATAANASSTAAIAGGVVVTSGTLQSASTGYTPTGLTNMTAEMWMETTQPVAAKMALSSRNSSNQNGFFFLLEQTGGGHGGIEFGIDNAGSLTRVSSDSDPTTNSVHHAVGTHAAGANAVLLYVDGTSTGFLRDSAASNPANSSVALQVGREGAGGTPLYSDGKFDEVRISNVVRDANWIKTEYRNQSSPNTFYTLGTEQTLNTGSIRHRVDQ